MTKAKTLPGLPVSEDLPAERTRPLGLLGWFELVVAIFGGGHEGPQPGSVGTS